MNEATHISDLPLSDYISRLETTNREWEQLAQVASHDVQEQLRNITNYVGILSKNVTENTSEEFTLALDVVERSSARMSMLIAELLSFSRIGVCQRIERIDCALLLKELLAEMNDNIVESSATINVEPMPFIDYDAMEIKQVFRNLIGNALKFKDKTAPAIDIRCEDFGEYLKFSISDNGIGIKEKYFDKIFILFKRLHADDDYEGIGKGLAVCKKIIEWNNGNIGVASTEGRGSTFFFTVPKRPTKQS